jgi:Holliday junction resolvase
MGIGAEGMTNSRAKGAAGERELANRLKELGLTARRGQQFSGSPDSPDVLCDHLSGYHIECKRVERLNIDAAMDQATRDCGSQTPIVMHRRNKKPWLVTMFLEDFIALARPVSPPLSADEIAALNPLWPGGDD